MTSPDESALRAQDEEAAREYAEVLHGKYSDEEISAAEIGFIRGIARERERSRGLVEALESIAKSPMLPGYDDAQYDAVEALKKWRGAE